MNAQRTSRLISLLGLLALSVLLLCSTGCSVLPASGIYVEGSTYVKERGERVLETERYSGSVRTGTRVQTFEAINHSERFESANPYGALALGYEKDFTPKWRAFAEASYSDAFNSKFNRDEKCFAVGVRWYPFR